MSVIIVTPSFQTQSLASTCKSTYMVLRGSLLLDVLGPANKNSHLTCARSKACKRIYSSLYPESSAETGGGSWLCPLMNAVQSFTPGVLSHETDSPDPQKPQIISNHS